ncbi:hypothetical protein 7S11_8 [uncultured Caudovirales phage]|uniref:MuF-like minor capsid protein n=1 Tax=uncultured Caudovirales phage TaxID=2100421 RepID=A0A2H4J4Q3_9CAUD|nr:hypothetical protein 7S11_8 [uncultured Caudovirales phage]
MAELAEVANDDLAALWGQVETAAEARTALADLLPAVVDVHGEAAAALAADWYDELRDEMSVRGRFTAIAADTADRGVYELAGWAVEPLAVDDTDWAAVRTRLYGGLQRRITDVARDTVTMSSVEDPGADGWQRVARSGGCGFCRMLAGRGAVYTSRTADFSSHDGCHCVATVAWKGIDRPVKPYAPSGQNITDADRARVRAWIQANP